MTKQELLLLLDDALELEPGTLKGTEYLNELKWDSLAVVTFLALIEEHLEVLMEPDDVAACETIQSLIDLLDGKLKS